MTQGRVVERASRTSTGEYQSRPSRRSKRPSGPEPPVPELSPFLARILERVKQNEHKRLRRQARNLCRPDLAPRRDEDLGNACVRTNEASDAHRLAAIPLVRGETSCSNSGLRERVLDPRDEAPISTGRHDDRSRPSRTTE